MAFMRYCVVSLLAAAPLFAQSLGNAGTIEGTVIDPVGGVVVKAEVTLHHAVSGYSQLAQSGPDGSFRLTNIPPNSYHLEVTVPGFAVYGQNIDVRSPVPIQVKVALALAGTTTSVMVEGAAEALETNPSAHVDVDRSQLLKMPASDPGGGLSQAIVYSTGGVAADGNGFFHPLGDHAQASFS